MESWAALIIKVEGEGDIDFATDYNNKNGIIKSRTSKRIWIKSILQKFQRIFVLNKENQY